jgi:hypothetical protein
MREDNKNACLSPSFTWPPGPSLYSYCEVFPAFACWEKMIPYLLGLNSNCYFAHTPIACTIGPSVNNLPTLNFLSKSIFCNLIKFMMKKWLKIQCLHHLKFNFFQISFIISYSQFQKPAQIPL